MKDWTKGRRLVAAAAAALVLTADAAHAHHAVLRFNLEEMVLTADRIFIGRCVAVEPTSDVIAGGRLPVTRYTFDVEQSLKGAVPARLTFTQLGHPGGKPEKGVPEIHGQAATPGLMLHGMSAYAVGERALLFLIPNYMNGKLTYPVGLEQGAFLLEEGDGDVEVRNNLNNIGLFDAPYNSPALKNGGAKVIAPDAADPLGAGGGLSSAARGLAARRGALPLGPVIELVKTIHAAHAGGKL